MRGKTGKGSTDISAVHLRRVLDKIALTATRVADVTKGDLGLKKYTFVNAKGTLMVVTPPDKKARRACWVCFTENKGQDRAQPCQGRKGTCAAHVLSNTCQEEKCSNGRSTRIFDGLRTAFCKSHSKVHNKAWYDAYVNKISCAEEGCPKEPCF